MQVLVITNPTRLNPRDIPVESPKEALMEARVAIADPPPDPRMLPLLHPIDPRHPSSLATLMANTPPALLGLQPS